MRPPWTSALLLMAVGHAATFEAPTGHFAWEQRVFPRTPEVPGRIRRSDAALSGEVGLRRDPGGPLTAEAKAFARVDEKDPERTRFDLPELLATWRSGSWRLDAGQTRIFWGVTEGRHLVDIVNQTDASGDLDGEDKLGQPLLRTAWNSAAAGLLEALLMTGFRPRPFPGATGRPGLPYPVRDDDPGYASAAGRWSPDLALRWSHAASAWDWALSGFAGTARDPRLRLEGGAEGIRIRPRYDRILQAGSEAQWTAGAWSWKLEALARRGQGPWFTAATGGLEYQVPAAWSSGDLTVFLEYNRDTRRNGSVDIYDNDLFAALRWAAGGPDETTLEAGCLADVEQGTVIGKAEAGRRFLEVWLAKVEGRIFSIREAGILEAFRRDHHLRLELRRVF